MLRIVCGDQTSYTPHWAERKRRLEVLESPVRDLARHAEAGGVVLAIENHADFVMPDLVELVTRIDSESVGICFDVGNTVRVGDDPLAAARSAAPFVAMAQIRDVRVLPGSIGDPRRGGRVFGLATGRSI